MKFEEDSVYFTWTVTVKNNVTAVQLVSAFNGVPFDAIIREIDKYKDHVTFVFEKTEKI